MQNWKEASDFEKIQFQAILGFLSHRPQLITFLFSPLHPRLREAPEKIVFNSGDFCSSDQILVRLALNLWCNHGPISVHELFGLDSEVFANALNAIKILGPKPCNRFNELIQKSQGN